MYTYIMYIMYIIYMRAPRAGLKQNTGVRDKKAPFARAFASQHSSSNCSPAPESVFLKLSFPRVFFSGGVSCHRRRYARFVQQE